jgi:hypothetical protein
MAIEISVTRKAFTWLGSVFEEKSAVSPFLHLAEGGFSEEDKTELQKIGIINAEGVMNAECYAALEPLASARSYASFRMASDCGITERYVYFRDEEHVALDIAGDRADVSFPADNESYAGFIGNFTGNSVLSNTSLSCELEPYDALVFAGLVDLTRIAALKTYAGAAGAEMAFSAGDVVDFVRTPRTEGKWLSGYIHAAAESEFGITAEMVNEIVKQLYAQNLAEMNGEKVALCGKAADFAANFLIIENVVTLSAGGIAPESDEVSGSRCHFLQAGINDVLQIDPSGGKFRFDAVSPAVMLDYVKVLLDTAPGI